MEIKEIKVEDTSGERKQAGMMYFLTGLTFIYATNVTQISHIEIVLLQRDSKPITMLNSLCMI